MTLDAPQPHAIGTMPLTGAMFYGFVSGRARVESITLLLAFGMSMMVNDTPVLVLMLPVMAAIAANGGMPASRTLIPVNSAVLIGGMSTTIGTSTNLLVVSIARDLGMPAMSVFHFKPAAAVPDAPRAPYVRHRARRTWDRPGHFSVDLIDRALHDRAPSAGRRHALACGL